VALVRKGTIPRPSDRRLSAKVVPTFADRGCRVVSATDPHGRILGFLDRKVAKNVFEKYVDSNMRLTLEIVFTYKFLYVF
jgi:hypothetical protein